MQNLVVTLIQSNLHWENIPANLEMFSKKITAIQGKPDIIVLPETFSTGFTIDAKEQAEEMESSKAVEWMKRTAKEKNCVVTGSLMLREKKKFFNRLIWMQSDGNFQIYDKRHLFSYADEDATYTAGEERLIVELNGWKICPLVCYDLRFPVWSRNSLSPAGVPAYDVLLYVANWPERRVQAWKYLLIARAIENQSYVVGLNRTGNDGKDNYYSGDSLVADALGNILYHKAETEDIYTIELNYDELQIVRNTLQFLKDADPFALDQRSKIKSH